MPLERAGWTVKRRRGSHVILGKRAMKNIVVPDHGRRPVKRPVVRGILRDAELSEDEFLEFV